MLKIIISGRRFFIHHHILHYIHTSSSYSDLIFIPFSIFIYFLLFHYIQQTIRNEFKKFTNMYFLVVGIIMYLGFNNIIFSSVIDPKGILAPLAVFIIFALGMEFLSDMKRHKNDHSVNTFSCIVIGSGGGGVGGEGESTTGIDNTNDGDDAAAAKIPWDDIVVPIVVDDSPSFSATNTTTNSATTKTTVVKFSAIKRKDIRQGQLVVIRNRESVPADTILLASSGELGCAYIETSSIDGETNLKLRLSAKVKTTAAAASTVSRSASNDSIEISPSNSTPVPVVKETMDDAIKRLSTFTSLGCINNDQRIAIVTTELRTYSYPTSYIYIQHRYKPCSFPSYCNSHLYNDRSLSLSLFRVPLSSYVHVFRVAHLFHITQFTRTPTTHTHWFYFVLLSLFADILMI